MTSYQQAKAIYLQAIRMPQAELNTFLDEQCGDDQELRRELELLVESDTEEDTVLEGSSSGTRGQHANASTAPELQPGDLVAGHRIIRKLGDGGMGAVYLARDVELDCDVAFKVLHQAHDTPVFNAQFIQERKTLAKMQHPGIARVRQAGFTPGGRAWFTMDYIDGSPLTSYCDQKRLDLNKRLELFIKICEAVQYAHGKMVIHRDLKPNNIMVTTDDRGEPQPHIIDFGISRLLEPDPSKDPDTPELPARCGTPPYMSPEQYLGQEDHVEVRSDIYALGVLLYRLTTGCEPFDRQILKKSLQELGAFLGTTTPLLPSDRFKEVSSLEQTTIAEKISTTKQKLIRRLRNGIDWIAFTAVAPQREDRYSSADSMASELKRFLAQQPVEAVPPSQAYRAKLFVRRNWVAVATIGLIIYLLIGGTSIALYQKNRLAEEASKNLALLEGSNEVVEMLRFTFLEGESPVSLGFENPNAKANSMNMLVAKLEDSKSINAETQATLRFWIGNIYLRLGLWNQAETQLMKARDLYTMLGPEYQADVDRITEVNMRWIRNNKSDPFAPANSSPIDPELDNPLTTDQFWQHYKKLFPDD